MGFYSVFTPINSTVFHVLFFSICHIKAPVSTVISCHLFINNLLYFFEINLRFQIISHPYPIFSHNNVLVAVALTTNPVHFATTSVRFFRRCTLNFK
jgi:hypothetical protein